MNRIQQYILIFLISSLVGCGFQLRGQLALPEALNRVYVQSAHLYGDLTQTTQRLLKDNKIQMVESPEEARLILDILAENFSQEVRSISATEQTRQITLVYKVQYQILDKNKTIILGPETITERRDQTVMLNQILSDTLEQEQLRQDMQNSAARRLLNRLGARQVISYLDTPSESR